MKLALRGKILLGNTIPLVLMAIIAGTVFFSVNNLLKNSGWVVHTYKVIGEAENLVKLLVDMETGMRGFLVAGQDEFLDPYNGGKKEFGEKIRALQQTVNDNPVQVKRLQGIIDTEAEWHKEVTKPMIALRRKVEAGEESMDTLIALQREARGKKYVDGMRVEFGGFVDMEAQLIGVRKAASQTSGNTVIGVAVGGTLVAILLSLLGGVMILRSIVGPISTSITGIREAADQVNSASNQLSNASNELASGTSEQAAGLEETSSSLEEMSTMTQQNADNAEQADGLVREASKAAGNGAGAMGEMQKAIDDIKNSTDETAKIIKTIDEIAFQTNLLALNAAVEAARAGDAGRGFAVVAEEVRNLAQRSAEAARNTNELIEDSQGKAQQGVEVSQTVETALNEIRESVDKVTGLVAEVASASKEQSRGINQITQNVNQMDAITQRNAANAEETASTSQELSSQAEMLNGMVDDMLAIVGQSAQEKQQVGTRVKSTGNGGRNSRKAAPLGIPAREAKPSLRAALESDVQGGADDLIEPYPDLNEGDFQEVR